MLDLDNLSYVPLNEPVNQIVFAKDRGGVRDVMIDGRIVVEDGRLTTVDMDKLRADVEVSVESKASARAAARERVESLTVHVGPFCTGFTAKDFPVNRFVG